MNYISERLGQSTVITTGQSQGEISTDQAAKGFTGQGGSISTSVVPLMNAEEVSRFFSRQSERQVIFWPGSNPIALQRVEYYRDSYFDGMWDKRSET